MIKTSKHHFSSYINTGKQNTLSYFLDECERMFNLILDDIWENGYTYVVGEKTFKFDPRNGCLDCPKFIDYNSFKKFDTTLSARALNDVVAKLCGVISASTEKQRKRIFIYRKLRDEGQTKKQLSNLINKIKQNNPTKPNIKKFFPELSSKCVKLIGECNRKFLKLSSILKDRQEIIIPIFEHKQSLRLKSKSEKRLGSFLISKSHVEVRYQLPTPKKKNGNIKIGIDQGLKDVITTSDGQIINKTCKHGHSLENIIERLSRKQKGSNGFKRSQDHRKNFINWTINQLNLDNIDIVGLERIWNIGFKNTKSRILSHWTNTIIRDKIEQKCLESGVHLIHQTSTYRSQRCSSCGNVRKSNRKGKIYSCKNCNNELDADYNASLNHEQNLPDVPYGLRQMNLNRGKGFLWLESGFFGLDHGILEYPSKE